MPLTPEEVVNKRFSQTQFRAGYDQDEVDDFLDEVVIELRRLIQENEDLQLQFTKISSSEQPPTPVVAEEKAAVQEKTVVEEKKAIADLPVASVQPAEDESVSTTNLLQLAQRLHDEHVKEGATKRDALIAEGQSAADRLLEDARMQQSVELEKFVQEKNGLESRIDELRTFEKEYRMKLRGYIESQLHELDAPAMSNGEAAAPVPSLQGFGA